MKLNYDCIRDILLTIEENATYYNSCIISSDTTSLSSYPFDEVLYHIKQCDLSNFLHNSTFLFDGTVDIEDLTPKGHEFLNQIRSDKVWDNTKNVCKELGVKSLSAVSQISTSVISQIITKYLGM